MKNAKKKAEKDKEKMKKNKNTEWSLSYLFTLH